MIARADEHVEVAVVIEIEERDVGRAVGCPRYDRRIRIDEKGCDAGVQVDVESARTVLRKLLVEVTDEEVVGAVMVKIGDPDDRM